MSAPTLRLFLRSIRTSAALWRAGRLRRDHDQVGLTIEFDDGTSSVVYRRTIVDDGVADRPALLVVRFRLRLVGRNPVAHAVFRSESILHTPLFAGFAGFRSKLWLTDLSTGVYRGVYEWDGEERAAEYATTLGRLLDAVSTTGSVAHHVEPGVRPAQVLAEPDRLPRAADPADAWWRFRLAPVPAPGADPRDDPPHRAS